MIQPLGTSLLAQPIEEKTESGIIMPDTASTHQPEQVKVLEIGEKVNKAFKNQIVLIKKYAGEELKVEKEKFYIVEAEDVIAIIK